MEFFTKGFVEKSKLFKKAIKKAISTKVIFFINI